MNTGVVAFMSTRLTPGCWVVDGGAGQGDLTLPVATVVGPTGHVLAVEPLPANAATLRQQAKAPQVTVVEGALTAVPGPVTLYTKASEPLTGSLIRANLELPDGECTVTGHTIDQLTADWPRLDAIKLDLQGGEPLALIGAEQALARWHPWLVVEIWPKGLKAADSSVEAVMAWLGARGYRRDPSWGMPYPFHGVYTDWLFVT